MRVLRRTSLGRHALYALIAALVVTTGAAVLAGITEYGRVSWQSRNASWTAIDAQMAHLRLSESVSAYAAMPDERHRRALSADLTQFQRQLPKLAELAEDAPGETPQTIYNMLCDIEWDTPVGEAKACGGLAMMRVHAFDSVRGFRVDLIAGEEPELCVRLRGAGWRIWRLGEEMALHDTAMTRFGQWWKRSKRAGYAFAEGASLHGAPPERHYVSEARRALLWGVLLPVLVLASAFVDPRVLGLLAIYPLQVVRVAMRSKLTGKKAWWRAVFLVLGRFPEGLGLLSFLLNRALHRRGARIEYK